MRTAEEMERARSRAASALYVEGEDVKLPNGLGRRPAERPTAAPEPIPEPPPKPVSSVSRRRLPPRPKPAPKPKGAPKPKPAPKATCDKGHPRDYQPPSQRWPICLICHREHARLSKARKRERERQVQN